MLLVYALACTGEGTPDSGGEAPLVDGSAWVLDLDHADPLAEHRPDDAACSLADIDEEYGGIEIETGACTYAQLVQPLGQDLSVGDPLHIVAWHQALAAEAPAEAHLAVLVGDEVLWERVTTVPGDAEAWDEHFDSPLSASEGTFVLLHLHNHGANSWTLQSLQRAADPESR